MIESSRELINVNAISGATNQEPFNPIFTRPSNYLVEHQSERTFLNTWFLITKRRTACPYLLKSAAKCARNSNSNWKWHKKRGAWEAPTVNSLMNQSGEWARQSSVSSMQGAITGCCCRAQTSIREMVCVMSAGGGKLPFLQHLLDVNCQDPVLKNCRMRQVLLLASF